MRGVVRHLVQIVPAIVCVDFCPVGVIGVEVPSEIIVDVCFCSSHVRLYKSGVFRIFSIVNEVLMLTFVLIFLLNWGVFLSKLQVQRCL